MGLLTLASGINVRDKGHCRKCGAPLPRGARVRPIWIAAGTTRHPKTGKTTLVLQSRTDMPAPQNEYAHCDCKDPNLTDIARIESAERPNPMDMNLPDIEPRGDDAHCIKCKKLFLRGDRLTLVYTVQAVGKDPETGAEAAKVTGSYEPKHEDCNDPKLDFGQGGGELIISKP